MTTPLKAWTRLVPKRTATLKRARKCSELTIVGLLPQEGQTDDTELPTPYQSLGARGVNNLSSKILMTMLPPDTGFFRFNIDEDVAKELGETLTEAENALSAMERKTNRWVEVNNYRPIVSEIATHLVVAGNCLLHMPKKMKAKMYRLDQYCIRRDGRGKPMEIVIKEMISPKTFSPEIQEALKLNERPEDQKDKDIELYTLIEWKDKKIEHKQVVNNITVPDSEGSSPEDKPAWLPLRWKSSGGEHYGRSHVMDYLGDLISAEELNKAIISFAAVAAKVVFLTHPNGTTDEEDIADADTGDFVEGSLEDIDVLQLDKFADFQIASKTLDNIEQRLATAFLLQAGATRNAERVTAEEIRAVAQELEDALGGSYTVLSSEFQLPFAKRIVHLMTTEGLLPNFPKDTITPMIVTGFEALGRNHSTNKLRAWLGDYMNTFGQEAMADLNRPAIAQRLGAGHGVEGLSDLIKSPEQIAQEQQQAQMNQMAQQSAPAAIQETLKQSGKE